MVRRWRDRLVRAAAVLFLLAVVACKRPAPEAQIVVVQPAQSPLSLDTALTTPTLAPATEPALITPLPTPTARPSSEATPFYQGPLSPACGQRLPLLPAASAPLVDTLAPDAGALAYLQSIMPGVARPALQRILAAPATVGLAAYRAGEEADGVYLNADMPMPLASVVKVIHLVAYAEAVAGGRLNPLSPVLLPDLEAYYLPRSDLGAHTRALRELEDEGRVVAELEQTRMEDVPWLMIRHSSNAAMDYLHLVLGQSLIEETAVALGLASQTAPCPFLGQFLAMGNHTRSGSDRSAIDAYLDDPATYGRDVMLFTDAYRSSAAFRQQEIDWRGDFRRPARDTQRYFSHQLNAQGSARDYANLIARIAQNGLSNGESSFTARRYLEWPMRFPNNQEIFSNLGYKNGSLPGILTTVYYAYPKGEVTPVVVALFFRDLPQRTYQQWRDTLPHDELARWLLAEPGAIPALRAVLNS
ncbi:MAG TPA: serine hydrolase [Anaerolineae bacterium]